MKKNIPVKPTRKETQAAFEAQTPLESQQLAPKKRGAFEMIAPQSRNAMTMFGEATGFIRSADLFNPDYKDGLYSPPFFIRNAFAYVSKEGLGQRFGMEIIFDNHAMYNVGLPLNPNDRKRNGLLEYFKTNTEPIGPVMLKKLPRPVGEDYNDIVPYHEGQQNEDAVVPFEDVDESLPF